jgi:hypothetical protein
VEVPSHIFRAYYVDLGVFEMLGRRYEIEPLADEVVRVHDQLVIFDRAGGRLARE